jgi:hypothetical protein
MTTQTQQATALQSISVDTEAMDWTSGVPFYGPGAVHGGRDVVQLKVLSDRRSEGGGIAWLVRMTPPEGKVIRIVAVALSDEHIFGLEGGRGTKSGERLRARGNYGLNPKGKPHSAFIGTETVSLVIYNGEPDEIRSLDVIDKPEG